MNTPQKSQSNIRILRWPDVKSKTGLCRSYVHSLISQNKFPAQIKLGIRASGWLESDINDWIEQRVLESRADKAA